MDPKVIDKNSEDLPDQKRQKLENEELEDDDISSSGDSSSLGYDDEDIRLFDEEYERSGDYDFDFSRVRYPVGFRQVIFDECHFADEPETDRVLVEKMCKAAIKKYNDVEKTSLEFVKALKANWSLAAGITFCIAFEAKDASSDHTIIPFQARVRYFLKEFIVGFVQPKP